MPVLAVYASLTFLPALCSRLNNFVYTAAAEEGITDIEESVAEKALHALACLAELGLFRKKKLWCVNGGARGSH